MNAVVPNDDVYADLKAAFESSTGDKGGAFGITSAPQGGQPEASGDGASPGAKLTSDTSDSQRSATPPTTEKDGGARHITAATQHDATIDPPVRWTKEEKEQWAQLPEAAQRILNDRNKRAEGELTKKFQFLASRSKEFADLEELIKPREQFFKRNGDTAASYLSKVFAVSDFAESKPADFIIWFAQERGIDLLQLVDILTNGKISLAADVLRQGGVPPQQRQPQQQGGNGRTESVDPQARAIIGDLQQKVETLARALDYERSVTAQQQDQTVDQTLYSFANAKDARGELLHPLLDEVEADMAVLYRNGVKDLEACYQKAVWANENTRQKLLETHALKAGPEYLKQQQQRAAAASRGAVSLRAAETPAPPSQAPADDILTELRRNYEIVTSRGAARV